MIVAIEIQHFHIPRVWSRAVEHLREGEGRGEGRGKGGSGKRERGMKVEGEGGGGEGGGGRWLEGASNIIRVPQKQRDISPSPLPWERTRAD